jgi:hypothetical protein
VAVPGLHVEARAAFEFGEIDEFRCHDRLRPSKGRLVANRTYTGKLLIRLQRAIRGARLARTLAFGG